MRCASVKMLVAIAILLTVTITSCGTDESTGNSVGSDSVSGVGPTPPLDPATATLDEILERSRIAMGDVTSYKIRGAVVTERSIGSDFVSSRRTDEFRVWQSPDRLHIRSESAASGFRDAHLTETVFMGDQIYSRSGTTGWQQPESFSPSRWSEQAYSAHVIVLDAPDMKLVSRNEETDDGTKVYRLEYTESPFLPLYEEAQAESEGPEGGIPRFPETVSTNLNTLLIDQQTFRIFAQFTNGTRETTPADRNTADADGANVMLSSGTDERRHTVQTAYYYDYNVPNVIEPPTEFDPPGSVQINRDKPPVLPENMFTGSCSEPGASWPECAVQTAAEFETMLSVFPEDHKISVGDDVVITFAFEGPPNIDWPADGFIWHAPSGSFMIMCVSDSPEPEFRFWKFSGSSHQRNFPEAEPRLSQVWADDEVANLIRGRTYEVRGSCE